MTRTLRENGPALLVPAAWIVAAATVAGAISTHALFVAHVIMAVLLVTFVVASWGEMKRGVLRAWKLVILGGTPVTIAGVAGFLALDDTIGVPAEPLLAVALYGWIALPAAGFLYTARHDEVAPRLYDAAAVCCLVGLVVVSLAATPSGTVAGLAVVGIGQTAGILAATLLY